MKISRKLALGFLSVIILIPVLGYIALDQSERALEESIGQGSTLLAQEMLGNIDRTIYTRIQDWSSYAQDSSLQEYVKDSNQEFDSFSDVDTIIAERDDEWTSTSKETLTPFMQELINNDQSVKIRENVEFYQQGESYHVFDEVFITNKHGANIAQTGRTSDYYQADEDWWQQAKENGLHVADVEYDESAGVYSTDIAIRIDDATGNFLGVMKVILNIEEIISIIQEREAEDNMPHYPYDHGSHESMHFKLLTKDGKLLYSTKNHFEILEDLSEEEQIEKSLGRITGFFVVDGDEPGEGEELFTYARSRGYKDFAGLGWVLIIEHETKEIFASITKLRTTLLSVFIIVLLLVLVIGFGLSRSISRPLKELTQATKEIEKGNFAVKVNIKTSDELEQLGCTFNKAALALSKLDQKQKQLERAKTEFISITSHELRSPMTPMLAQLDMLHDGIYGKLNKKQQNSVGMILRNTERLDRIILDFLEVSRIEAARLKFNFTKTGLTEHIKKLVTEMEGFLPEKNIKLIVKIAKLPQIECDPDRVMQVLRNLINNAKKFTPEEGRVTITVRPRKNDLLFSVKDNGIGVPRKVQKRLFEPFFQAENTMYRKHGGTGLGLTICRGIVEAQKGKLWIESKAGKGSTFYFTIPKKPVKEMEPIKLLFSEQKKEKKL